MSNPPSSTAAVGDPGMPSVSIGSSALVPAACARGLGRDHALDLAGTELSPFFDDRFAMP